MPSVTSWSPEPKIEIRGLLGYTIPVFSELTNRFKTNSPLTSELQRAYQHCEQITRREARNFYFGFISLPRFRRQSISAVYALSRRWDDIADGDLPGEEKKQQLDAEESRLNSMQTPFDDPVYTAVRNTIGKFDIPLHYFHDLLDGVRLDLTKKRYHTFDELLEYCYHVASCPGLIVLEIFGYEEPRAREYARKLGYAMQLTNILRDVRKDLERDRIYLPLNRLKLEGVSEQDLLSKHPSPNIIPVMRFLAKKAEGYFRESNQLFPLITPSSRTCPLILMQLYRTLLKKLKRREFDVFSSPVNLSFSEKCMVLFDTIFFHPAAI